MLRIGCRAHDYGKLPAHDLAQTLRDKGYNAAQLADIRTAFDKADVQISVLSCYQDLTAPDDEARCAAR